MHVDRQAALEGLLLTTALNNRPLWQLLHVTGHVATADFYTNHQLDQKCPP